MMEKVSQIISFVGLLCVVSLSCLAEVHEVVVQDNNFQPANISIVAGDTIRWHNQGTHNHNVISTALEYEFRCANGCVDTGGDSTPAGFGWVSEVTFHKVDSSIPYLCEPHIGFGMTGSVSVQTPDEFETVTVSNSGGFQPQVLTIEQYSRVLFIKTEGAHNVHADDDSFRCADGCRADGVEGEDEFTGFPWQFFRQFNEPGSFPYHSDNPDFPITGVVHVTELPIFANGFESL